MKQILARLLLMFPLINAGCTETSSSSVSSDVTKPVSETTTHLGRIFKEKGTVYVELTGYDPYPAELSGKVERIVGGLPATGKIVHSVISSKTKIVKIYSFQHIEKAGGEQTPSGGK